NLVLSQKSYPSSLAMLKDLLPHNDFHTHKDLLVFMQQKYAAKLIPFGTYDEKSRCQKILKEATNKIVFIGENESDNSFGKRRFEEIFDKSKDKTKSLFAINKYQNKHADKIIYSQENEIKFYLTNSMPTVDVIGLMPIISRMIEKIILEYDLKSPQQKYLIEQFLRNTLELLASPKQLQHLINVKSVISQEVASAIIHTLKKYFVEVLTRSMSEKFESKPKRDFNLFKQEFVKIYEDQILN
ncbi:MAG: hypothetical protein ACRC37_05100, partial [Lentisphaeria bacterium]